MKGDFHGGFSTDQTFGCHCSVISTAASWNVRRSESKVVAHDLLPTSNWRRGSRLGSRRTGRVQAGIQKLSTPTRLQQLSCCCSPKFATIQMASHEAAPVTCSCAWDSIGTTLSHAPAHAIYGFYPAGQRRRRVPFQQLSLANAAYRALSSRETPHIRATETVRAVSHPPVEIAGYPVTRAAASNAPEHLTAANRILLIGDTHRAYDFTGGRKSEMASQNQGRRGSIRRIAIAFGWNPKSVAPSERMAFSPSTSTSIALGAKIPPGPVTSAARTIRLYAFGGRRRLLVSAAADLYPGASLARSPDCPMLRKPVIVTGGRSPSRTTTQQITRRRWDISKICGH